MKKIAAPVSTLLPMVVLLAAWSCTGALAQGPVPPKPSGIAPGLYVSVTDGQIVLSNKGGATNFTAGQFGYTASVTQPPVLIPKNPAIQFTPPPVFNSTTTSQASNTTPKSGSVDCEVR